MPTTKLLEKLLEIERSLRHTDDLRIRALVMEAQMELLQVQADMIRLLEDMGGLREQQERCPASAFSPVLARAEQEARLVPGLARLAARTA
jgi:hypothetical protein